MLKRNLFIIILTPFLSLKCPDFKNSFVIDIKRDSPGAIKIIPKSGILRLYKEKDRVLFNNIMEKIKELGFEIEDAHKITSELWGDLSAKSTFPSSSALIKKNKNNLKEFEKLFKEIHKNVRIYENLSFASPLTFSNDLIKNGFKYFYVEADFNFENGQSEEGYTKTDIEIEPNAMYMLSLPVMSNSLYKCPDGENAAANRFCVTKNIII